VDGAGRVDCSGRKAVPSRRQFLQALGAAAVGAGLSPSPSPAQPASNPRPPNVLVILTDDQRFDTIQALGNEQIVTPNMDWLVRHGTTCTNAYIMGSTSGAVCMPSRAMLLSGRTLFHLEKQGGVVPPEHVTFPEVFRRAGYATFQTGKWHQDPRTYNRCFTQGARIFFGGMSDHFKVPVHDYDPTGRYPKESTYVEEGKHSSELFSDAAVRFLRGHDGGQPFLMYIAYTAPHDPRDVPAPYRQMYDPAAMKLPPSFLPEHPFDNGELKIRDENLAPWPRTPAEIRRHQAAYYAMITHLDAQIGRVLDALRETGRLEHTLIVFAADNGLALGCHGLLGKQNLYEHSVRVPLVLAGPGIAGDRKCDLFCYLLDVYPTLCELTGLPTPATVEGVSLAPGLRGRGRDGRESLFFAYRDVQRAVRDGRYKLIEYHVAGRRTTQLFDLENDPGELKNRAGDGRYEQEVLRLRGQLRRWQEKLDDNSTFWQGWDV
jgi:arylsulfatase A-like enzyme